MHCVAQLQAKNNRLAIVPYLLLIDMPELIPTTGPMHTALIQSRMGLIKDQTLKNVRCTWS